MMYSLFLASVMMGLVGAATNGGSQFRVRRRGQDNVRHLNADDDFLVTYSDDGKSKSLDRFILSLYETPGQLQDDAIPILRMAMNKFLLAEFNAIYASEDNELESVGSEVFWFSSITRSGGRSLQEEVGTEAEMEVTFTFDSEPSPSSKELEEKIRVVMNDLQNFIGNLTSFQHSDWMEVTEASRREMPTPSPTGAPVDITDGIQGGGNGGTNGGDNEDKGSSVGAIVPTTLVAATLIALVAFLFVQRRSRREVESPKGRGSMFISAENDLYSVDRSLESSRSPLGMRSPAGVSSIDYSTSVDESVPEDSVFSGIDYTPSNYSNVKGMKSLLSGFTNASAATIRASNMDKQERERLQSMAEGDSLYSFDKDDYNEDGTPNNGTEGTPEDSDMSNDSNPAGYSSTPRQDLHQEQPNAHQDASPSLHGTAIEQPKTRSFLPAYYATQPSAEPGTSSHDVLVDLDMLASSRGPVSRDPTPTAAGTTGSLYSNLFSCAPTLSTQPEKAMQYELDGTVNAEGTKDTPAAKSSMFACGPGAPGSATKTPLTRNVGASVLTPGSTTSHRSTGSHKSSKSNGSGRNQPEWEVQGTVGTMSGKATRMIGGAYGAEESDTSNNRSRALSADEPTLRHNSKSISSGSKSAPTTPEKNRYNSKAFKAYRSMPMDESDYVNNLSRPSTPGGELAESLNLADYENTGYGCYPFRRNTTAPATPGETTTGHGRRHAGNTGVDGTTLYQTSAMNPIDAANGRRHAGNTGLDGTAMYQANTMHDPLNTASGRRHAGNTGIDGTAMYQENAMHPLEWSYKSADLHSVGDSTLSENDGAAMPRQFLFGGKRDRKTAKSMSPDREPKTPVSQRSGKSTKSTRTNESSQGSASRQLINDLVWLEKKIADVRQGSMANDPPDVATVDSLSYVSDDNTGFASMSSRDESEDEPTVSTGRNESVMSSIVCRDCYAPPGKLHIVIHSTKDGPAVHTVKQGSSLEGHVFPGDLIISVDNVDTRSYTAEQVMKMMASKSNQERKITVLHFEEED